MIFNGFFAKLAAGFVSALTLFQPSTVLASEMYMLVIRTNSSARPLTSAQYSEGVKCANSVTKTFHDLASAGNEIAMAFVDSVRTENAQEILSGLVNDCMAAKGILGVESFVQVGDVSDSDTPPAWTMPADPVVSQPQH